MQLHKYKRMSIAAFVMGINYNNFLRFWIKLLFLYVHLCKISYDNYFKDNFKDIIRIVQEL